MRLIDLDKVRWKDGFYDMHTGEQFAPMMFNTPEWIEWATAEAEVKAIPIEWAKEELDYARKMYDNSTELTEPYWRGNVSALEVLIIRWEEENEREERDRGETV